MSRAGLLSAVILTLLLAGCGGQPEGPMVPGIYEATQPDGTVTRMVFSNDGTYADMADNIPQPVDSGRWWRRDGQLCFESVNATGSFCFSEAAGEREGSFTLTGDEGQTTRFQSIH